MKTHLVLIFTLLFTIPIPAQAETPENRAVKEVYFSPDGGCEGAVVHEIDNAKNSIFMAIYVFNSKKIANAILRAKQRGLKVWVVVDKMESFPKYSATGYLASKGFYVLKDGTHPKMHDKFVVIDGHTVLTGSFNYTTTAERSNSENLLILRDDRDLAAKYLEHFAQHAKHASH